MTITMTLREILRRKYAPEPLFKSAVSAVWYALTFNLYQYPLTIMAKMMKDRFRIGHGKGLAGIEGAAVAGTILRHVDSLPWPYGAILRCRYSPNDKEVLDIVYGDEANGIKPLYKDMLFYMPSGIRSPRMVAYLVLRYFKRPDNCGNKMSEAWLCDKFGVSGATVRGYFYPIKKALRKLESEANDRIDNLLRDTEVVGENVL